MKQIFVFKISGFEYGLCEFEKSTKLETPTVACMLPCELKE